MAVAASLVERVAHFVSPLTAVTIIYTQYSMCWSISCTVPVHRAILSAASRALWSCQAPAGGGYPGPAHQSSRKLNHRALSSRQVVLAS